MGGTGSDLDHASSLRLWSGTSEVEKVGEALAHHIQHLRPNVADRVSQPLDSDHPDVLALRCGDHLETVARIRLDGHLGPVPTKRGGQRYHPHNARPLVEHQLRGHDHDRPCEAGFPSLRLAQIYELDVTATTHRAARPRRRRAAPRARPSPSDEAPATLPRRPRRWSRPAVAPRGGSRRGCGRVTYERMMAGWRGPDAVASTASGMSQAMVWPPAAEHCPVPWLSSDSSTRTGSSSTPMSRMRFRRSGGLLVVLHVEVVLLPKPVARHVAQCQNMPLTCRNTSM